MSGIYMLFKGHELVYVGKSKSAYGRIEQHRTNGREFDYAVVAPVPEADLAWVETSLIRATEAVQNRAGKKPSVPAKPERPTLMPPTFADRTVELPDDLAVAMAVGKAKSYAVRCRVHAGFDRAIEDGSLPSVVEGVSSRGAVRRYVMASDLKAWCVEQQRLKWGRKD